MPDRPNPISTAFWTYVIPMASTRAMKLSIAGYVLFLIVLAMAYTLEVMYSKFDEYTLIGMRHFVIMVVVPVGAVLLSEMPIRDGVTHRTMLYPLLGPVPRITIAIVRLVVTCIILAVSASILLVLIRILLQDGFGFLPRELLAVFLGAFAYGSLFGLVHLFNRRGLIAGLAILFIFDIPLGRLPFSIRNISPSYHMGVIAGQDEIMELPIIFDLPASSIPLSVVVLLGIALVFGAAMAIGFKRKHLGELC